MGNWIQTSSAGPQTGGGTYAPLLPSSVTAAENAGASWVDGNRVVHRKIAVTINRQADDGAEWFDLWLYDPAIGWGGTEGRWKVGDTVVIDRTPPASTTSGYKVGVTTGSSRGENNPANRVESATFSLSGNSRPAAGGVTVLTEPTFTNRVRPEDNSQYAYITPIEYQDPTTDLYAFFARWTVQVGHYAAGVWTPAPGRSAGEGDEGGDEVAHDGTQVTGSSHWTSGIAFDYNPEGSANTIMKFRCYLLNKLSTDTNDFLDTSMSRLQLEIDVDFGAMPAAGKIPADRLDPDTLGNRLTIDSATGLLVFDSTDPSNLAPDPNFELGGSGWQLNFGATVENAGGKTTPKCVKLPGNGSTPQVIENVLHYTRPGDSWYVECQHKSDVGADGSLDFQCAFYDSSQAFLSVVETIKSPTLGAWETASLTVTAPANASYFRFGPYRWTSSAGNWWIDNMICRPVQKSETIADAAIVTGKLADLAVEAAKLANSSVTATKIANLAVGAAAIQDAAISTAKIQDLAVTNGKIGVLAVGTANIQDAAITDAKIGSLAANKITTGTISAAISMTAPTLRIVSGTITANIDGTNYIKVANSATSRYTHHHYAYFRVAKATDEYNYAQMDLGSVTVSGPSGSLQAGMSPGYFWTQGGTGWSGTISYAKPGGGTGTITVSGGIIVGVT